MCEKRSKNEIITSLFKQDVLPCPLTLLNCFSSKAERLWKAFNDFQQELFFFRGAGGKENLGLRRERLLEYCSNLKTIESSWMGQN